MGSLCLTTIALACAQSLAILFSGFPEIWWYFTPSHFLGGMCVAYAALYVASGLGMRVSLAQILAVVLVVGLMWEVLEYGIGSHMTILDTVTDIIADVLGGFVAYRIVQRAR